MRIYRHLAFLVLSALFAFAPALVCAQEGSTEVINSQNDSANLNDFSKPLPESAVSAFKAMRSDPDPESLVRDAHYWISNESAHYVWHPVIKDMGGVLAGVGTDQVYLLADWAKSSIIVPLDFDKAITYLHFAYGAAFQAAETPEEFIALWGKSRADDLNAAIDKYVPEVAQEAKKSAKLGRSNVYSRLNRLVKKYTSKGIATFVTNQESYNYLRTMWMNKRVFPICGDLTGDKAMLDLAKALQTTGLKLGILYPSNAEHYFEYEAKYRRNIIELPFAENGLVLRTRQMAFLGLAEEEDYHYNYQKGENFKLWLKTTRIANQYKMLRTAKEKTGTTGLSVIQRDPEPSKKAPEIAPLP